MFNSVQNICKRNLQESDGNHYGASGGSLVKALVLAVGGSKSSTEFPDGLNTVTTT